MWVGKYAPLLYLAAYVPSFNVLPPSRLFMNCDLLTSEAQQQLASGGVQQFAYGEVANHITALLEASEGAVWVSYPAYTVISYAEEVCEVHFCAAVLACNELDTSLCSLSSRS